VRQRGGSQGASPGSHVGASAGVQDRVELAAQLDDQVLHLPCHVAVRSRLGDGVRSALRHGLVCRVLRRCHVLGSHPLPGHEIHHDLLRLEGHPVDVATDHGVVAPLVFLGRRQPLDLPHGAPPGAELLQAEGQAAVVAAVGSDGDDDTVAGQGDAVLDVVDAVQELGGADAVGGRQGQRDQRQGLRDGGQGLGLALRLELLETGHRLGGGGRGALGQGALGIGQGLGDEGFVGSGAGRGIGEGHGGNLLSGVDCGGNYCLDAVIRWDGAVCKPVALDTHIVRQRRRRV
jgi:hypothetical protein